MDDLSSLTTYTIYENPDDAPGLFVVRKWVVSGGGPQAMEAENFQTLGEARLAIPPGFVNMGRDENDDEKIVESWI